MIVAINDDVRTFIDFYSCQWVLRRRRAARHRPGTKESIYESLPDTWPNLDAQFLGDRPIRVHGTTQFSTSAGRNRCRQSIAPGAREWREPARGSA
jgi:hypothetical protein